MFSKIVVLYEIYSKKLQWPNTFGKSLYLPYDRVHDSSVFRYSQCVSYYVSYNMESLKISNG